MFRILCFAVVLAAATACSLAGDGSEPSAAPSTTETAASGSPTSIGGSAPVDPDSSGTATAPAGGRTIEVLVVDGAVSGGPERIDVSLGETITVRVVADVVDEVHVHGYDRTAATTAGTPGEITFDAEIPGVFEVELEGLGLKLVELEVS